jgi:hypothetical protein
MVPRRADADNDATLLATVQNLGLRRHSSHRLKRFTGADIPIADEAGVVN